MRSLARAHARSIADVHAIEHERLGVDIQPERGVSALDECADLRFLDRAQAQLALRASMADRQRWVYDGGGDCWAEVAVDGPQVELELDLEDKEEGKRLVGEGIPVLTRK